MDLFDWHFPISWCSKVRSYGPVTLEAWSSVLCSLCQRYLSLLNRTVHKRFWLTQESKWTQLFPNCTCDKFSIRLDAYPVRLRVAGSLRRAPLWMSRYQAPKSGHRHSGSFPKAGSEKKKKKKNQTKKKKNRRIVTAELAPNDPTRQHSSTKTQAAQAQTPGSNPRLKPQAWPTGENRPRQIRLKWRQNPPSQAGEKNKGKEG